MAESGSEALRPRRGGGPRGHAALLLTARAAIEHPPTHLFDSHRRLNFVAKHQRALQPERRLRLWRRGRVATTSGVRRCDGESATVEQANKAWGGRAGSRSAGARMAAGKPSALACALRRLADGRRLSSRVLSRLGSSARARLWRVARRVRMRCQRVWSGGGAVSCVQAMQEAASPKLEMTRPPSQAAEQTVTRRNMIQ